MSANRFLASLFGTANSQHMPEVRYSRFAHRPVERETYPVPFQDREAVAPARIVQQPVVRTLVIDGSNEGGGDIPVSVLHRALPLRTATRNT